MQRNFIMDGTWQKIEGLFWGIEDIVDPDVDPFGLNAKGFATGVNPQVHMGTPPDNKYPIFFKEQIQLPNTAMTWLHPGGSKTYDASATKKMNIFYAIGSVGDVLFLEAR